MKKLTAIVSAGFALFFCVFTFSPAFADKNTPSILYEGGYVQDILTSRQPTPWNIVKHYVGDDSKLITLILTEQGISLNPRVKFPVGMAVRVPQKHVKKELLPSPSAAEKMLADLTYQAELKKQIEQAELFIAELKIKDTQIIGHWIFDALLIGTIVFLLKSRFNSVKKNNKDMDFILSDHQDVFRKLEEANKQLGALQNELAAKKSAETKRVWTPEEIKDALMQLTLRQTRDLLEWEALAVHRDGGGESKVKLKNLPNFLKDKDENLFDIRLQLMSDHKVAHAPTEKPS